MLQFSQVSEMYAAHHIPNNVSCLHPHSCCLRPFKGMQIIPGFIGNCHKKSVNENQYCKSHKLGII